MGYTYEITLAPSEVVSNYGARAIGTSVEIAIFTHYLTVTGAPIKPGGAEQLTDFMDTGNRYDYVKLLLARHPGMNEKELRADAQKKDAMGVPDISTYAGRFVPPRILSTGEHPIEDKSRSEYYEIKPNSDTGEQDGKAKLKKIAEGNPRYGLSGIYQPGTIYPQASPTYIPLKFSQAFEYLKLVFMWENNLKSCEIDLQVVRLPTIAGLVFYAFRIRFELDIQLALDKLRFLATGVAVAAAACAAAGILELAADLVGSEVAKALLDSLKKLVESQEAPPPTPKFRIGPDPPVGPRIAEPPITPPAEIPEVELEPEDFDADDELFPKMKKALAAAALGRAFALPRKKINVFCDEDFYKNIIFDDSTVRRFVAMTRLALPLSPTITVSSGYLRMAVPGWRLVEIYMEQIEQRFPNQCRLRAGPLIPDALRRIGQGQVTIVSHVLVLTPEIAAFIDPGLRAKAYADGKAFSLGSVALPSDLLSRWKGMNPTIGATQTPPTIDQLAASLLAGNPDARNSKYLTDALTGRDVLKHGLNAAPGFTLALGIHALYQLSGDRVTEQNQFGDLKAVNVSRLFAVNAAGGPAPAKPYQLVACGKGADSPIASGSELAYFIGRMRVSTK